MDKLYLLQFACFVFILVSAGYLGLSSLHVHWRNRRFERSRWMLFLALLMKIRVAGDDLGAVVNMLVYTPCFMLISKAIYNVEATQLFSRRMTEVCSAIYLIILAVFGIGYWRAGSFHIGPWLYVMLFFYVIGNVYCVGVILREMLRRRRMLETMACGG